jgi:hypothetical protein
MKPPSINQEDLGAGILFMAFGLIGLAIGSGYDLGSSFRMGPGYFPVTISGLLLAAGAVVSGQAVWSGRRSVDWGSLRPVVSVIAGVLAFGLLIEPAGYAIAALALVAIVFFGNWGLRIIEFIVLYIILVTSTVIIFIKLLQLPIRTFPWQ